MISEQLVRQVTQEQDNDRVYKIELCSRSITRISGLKPFSKLRCVQLSFNRISCIENLDYLPDLRELRLDHNEISSLGGLDSNKMLTVLTLTSNRIQKIQNIGHLIKLQTLMIDNNRIEKLAGLQTLKDLKYLSLSGNKLLSIDSLPAFSKLETLIADNNSIRKISNTIFAKSTKLIKLSLAFNEIEDVTFIAGLNSLEELNLSNNKIRDFSASALKNLEYLNISNNKIANLPRVSVHFPELSVFLFANNEVASEFEVIQSLAEAEMLVQIDFRGNFMDSPDFAETLFRVYGLDRINQKNYNKPGTRYVNQAHEIRKVLQEQGFNEIQNDEEVRKIIMSGFYNDDLEAEMTGIKPDRPNSSIKNRTSSLNFEDMERSFNEIVKNQKRLEQLRNQCRHIFQSNNIKVDFLGPKFKEEEPQKRQEERNGLITEIKNLADKTSSMNTITQLSSRNEENANKWKQLKNREKSFNIRGVVRKVSGSLKKQGNGTVMKQGSASKIGNQERSQLMKTQLNPPRWNNDPNLMKTMQSRPFSSKKTNK